MLITEGLHHLGTYFASFSQGVLPHGILASAIEVVQRVYAVRGLARTVSHNDRFGLSRRLIHQSKQQLPGVNAFVSGPLVL